MNQNIFDVFSDDDEEQDPRLINDHSTKRAGSPDIEREAKKYQQSTTTFADDYEQSVDKEYAAAKTTLVENTEEQLVVKHQVRHQVALPPNYPYVPISQHVPPKDPARTYPFTLDPFQRTAIHSIQRNESVLVSAHTSAGKTVVAEYAIATGLKFKQRVIYTSPIKALSNQKYRDLLEEFGDVGLMTGDVTINPDATCLVMTTEILRSMLYRGSEVMREVAWVVFDEIHYMRDKVRGVVWEETLILLPDKVRYVFLSATIPNAIQFAEWICKIKRQPCHVVFTNYRPTPLQHYLFPALGDGIHLVVDEKSNFREDNFQKAIGSVADKEEGKKKGRKSDKSTKGSSDLTKIIKMITQKNYHPVIVFSFSKKECEANALQLSKLDFNGQDEKDLVKSVYTNAIHSLGEDDRTLPQIEHLLPLLQRGIGIHHSGLLPILKEVIEILFQEGLLKVLFATETFSIGLNMPAKTVVFTSVRKFDGKEQRWLSGGEYIQMSGRAGRRGLDDRGIVILMIDEKMEPDIAKGMLKGVSDSLDSAFHLTYTMILNLSRVDGVTPEYMLESSFHQHQNTAKIPEIAKNIKIYEARHDEVIIKNEDVVAEYYNICTQLQIFSKDKQAVITAPTYILPFLQCGRLAAVTRGDLAFGWGIIVNYQKSVVRSKKDDTETLKYVVDILLYCGRGSTDNSDVKPCPDDEDGDMIVVGCTLDSISAISSVRINVPSEIKSRDSRHNLYKTVKEVKRRFKNEIPLLDPVKDMRIADESFKKLISKIQVLEKKKKESAFDNSPEKDELYSMYEKKVELKTKIRELKKSFSQAESILQMDELKSRRRVLRRLGYTTENDVIEVKGRVACEISAGDELMLTEMMFNGVFNDLTVEQTVAVLSCFTFGEGSKEENAEMQPEVKEPYEKLRQTAKRIAEISLDCKIAMDVNEYIDSFKPTLMSVVYAWAIGAKFSQICKMTDVFEGSIIRCMRRLEELLRQLVTASKAIGNVELENKFTAGIAAIKRDIVFANSLYL
ncbi:ATP-dependent RNA helicase mtr4 [Boothiomyces sp. JEL0866]|nr:ATP-dependent RNA helicase mtr4 [Boothiomyces sp. JEL0866]